MKPCKNENCHGHRPIFDSGCFQYGGGEGTINSLNKCPIYNRLYKKKVPERASTDPICYPAKLGVNDLAAKIYLNTDKINEIIDYLQEAE